MNAIELLKADHKVVEGLFKQVEGSDESDHPAIFEQIKAELEVHAHIEETVLYPSLQGDGDEELVELTAEALQEHMQAKTFLGELTVAMDDAEKFEPLLTKLIEDVRHHVKEEETIMFPTVEAQFDAETIKMWGEQLEAEKASFQTSTESAYA